MKLRNPSNREAPEEPPNPKNVSLHSASEDIDSNCSTPYVSAPSSPGRTFPSSAAGSGYFFSAPASPVHYVLSSAPFSAIATAGRISASASPERLRHSGGSFEFGGASPAGPMISADEIFLNGQIRPMKLSSHLQRPQALAPLVDLENEVEEEEEARGTRLRSRSIHRRARSMSPLRNRYQWEEEEEEEEEAAAAGGGESKADPDLDPKQEDPVPLSPPSRSSSSGKSSSKRWVFLKDLLYRSKSEGRGRDQKEKEKSLPLPLPKKKTGGNANVNVTPNGVSRRRRGGTAAPSAHERHYTANRAQAEEMRRRTFLPYRQGLLGCLGFSSRGYGAVNGIARTLNPVSS